MRVPPESSEQFNEMLDPHRREGIVNAAVEITARLQQKGIEASSDEDPALLADLLSAVERFEAAVINRGGDLFVNSPTSAEPQNPQFVVPLRVADETFEGYVRRVNEAAVALEGL